MNNPAPPEDDSPIGKYFALNAEGSHYVCRLCVTKGKKGRISATNGKGNCHRHLKSLHPQEYAIMRGAQDQFTHAVGRHVAQNLLPFSIVESPTFKDMIHMLAPSMKIPSRREIAVTTIPQLVEDQMNEFKMKVGDSYVALTSDGWSTVVGGVSLTSLTAQYVDENWTLQEMVLAAREIKGRHDAAAISACLTSVLSSFGLKNVSAAVTDGAPVMGAACRRMDIPKFSGIKQNDIVMDALLLDARFSHLSSIIADPTLWDDMSSAFLRRYDTAAAKELEEEADDDDKEEEEEDDPAGRMPIFTGSLLASMNGPVANKPRRLPNLPMIQNEWAEYISLLKTPGSRPKPTDSPYDFWKNNCARFPMLSAIARRLLAIPTTSVSSERLFSKATFIYRNTCRARLTGKRAEQCLLYAVNSIAKRRFKELSMERVRSLRLVPGNEDNDVDNGEDDTEEDYVDGDLVEESRISWMDDSKSDEEEEEGGDQIASSSGMGARRESSEDSLRTIIYDEEENDLTPEPIQNRGKRAATTEDNPRTAKRSRHK